MSISARNTNNVVPIRAWPFIISNNQEIERGFRENKTAIQDQIDKAKALFFKAGGKVKTIKSGIGKNYSAAPRSRVKLKAQHYKNRSNSKQTVYTL